VPTIAERKHTFQEPGIVELANGDLWMYIRTDLGSQFACVSHDKGITWTEPQPTTLASPLSPASVERIPGSEDLVCVWNDHTGRHPFRPGKRTPLAIAVSGDGGATWSASQLLGSDPRLSYCYTSITFQDHSLLLSYLSARQGSLSGDLVVMRVPLEWLQGRNDR
jgi:sialidase-1